MESATARSQTPPQRTPAATQTSADDDFLLQSRSRHGYGELTVEEREFVVDKEVYGQVTIGPEDITQFYNLICNVMYHYMANKVSEAERNLYADTYNKLKSTIEKIVEEFEREFNKHTQETDKIYMQARDQLRQNIKDDITESKSKEKPELADVAAYGKSVAQNINLGGNDAKALANARGVAEKQSKVLCNNAFGKMLGVITSAYFLQKEFDYVVGHKHKDSRHISVNGEHLARLDKLKGKIGNVSATAPASYVKFLNAEQNGTCSTYTRGLGLICQAGMKKFLPALAPAVSSLYHEEFAGITPTPQLVALKDLPDVPSAKKEEQVGSLLAELDAFYAIPPYFATIPDLLAGYNAYAEQWKCSAILVREYIAPALAMHLDYYKKYSKEALQKPWQSFFEFEYWLFKSMNRFVQECEASKTVAGEYDMSVGQYLVSLNNILASIYPGYPDALSTQEQKSDLIAKMSADPLFFAQLQKQHDTLKENMRHRRDNKKRLRVQATKSEEVKAADTTIASPAEGSLSEHFFKMVTQLSLAYKKLPGVFHLHTQDMIKVATELSNHFSSTPQKSLSLEQHELALAIRTLLEKFNNEVNKYGEFADYILHLNQNPSDSHYGRILGLLLRHLLSNVDLTRINGNRDLNGITVNQLQGVAHLAKQYVDKIEVSDSYKEVYHQRIIGSEEFATTEDLTKLFIKFYNETPSHPISIADRARRALGMEVKKAQPPKSLLSPKGQLLSPKTNGTK